MPLTYDDVEQILRIVDQDGYTELQIEHDGLYLKVRRSPTRDDKAAQVGAATAAPNGPSSPAPSGATTAVSAAPAIARGEDTGKGARDGVVATALAIAAPMPGTFYQAPAPGAAPFVRVGDVVAAGATVCILDVMKVMSHLTAPCAGRIVRIDATDAQTVSAGDPLVWIEPQ